MANVRDLTVGIDFSDIDIASLTALDSAIDAIEDQLQSMGNQMNTATAEFQSMAAGASGALNEIQSEANDAAQAVNELGNEDATPDGLAEAIAELLALQAAADAALNDIDDEAGDATRQINLMGFSFIFAALKATALGIAGVSALSAIIAAGAPLLLLAGGLGASFMAAGVGAAAFGAVAIPTLTGVFTKAEEIQKIEEKIAAADTAKERAAAQKELAAAMEGVSEAQKGAMGALSDFKEFWGGFTKQFETPIFEAFGGGLTLLQSILTGLAPTISNVADVVNELIQGANASVEAGGLKEFFGWLESNAAEAIRSFATIAGNLIQGVWNMFGAFSPIGATIEENLISLTDRFATWSEGLASSNGFQTFVDYALTNGPVLWQILKDAWQVIEDIVVAFAPLGTIVLEALGLLMGKLTELTPHLQTIVDEAINFGTAVAENWTPIQETVIALGTAVGSFVAIMKTMQIIGVINTLLTAYRAGTLVATAAQMGLNLAMLANPMTWVVAGIAALIAIGVLLYRNWDTVKAKASELWAAMKEKFAAIKESVTTALQPVIDFFGRMLDKWDAFKKSISNFKMPSFKLPSWLGGGKDDGSHATGLARVPFDGYRAELHQGEAVLTAQQSNALRSAGMLGSNGERPTLDLSPQVAPTVGSGGGGGGNTTFAPVVQIQIDGSNGDEERIAQLAAEATKRELEKFWKKMNLAT